jgi:hypothetical protein
MPPLCAKAFLPTYGPVRVRREVEQLVEEVRRLGEPLERRQAVDAELELEVRDDGDEVRVAAALAVAVHRALHHRAPSRTAAMEFATAHSASLWQWMPDRRAGRPHDLGGRGGDLVRQRRAVRVAQDDVVGARRRLEAAPGVRRVGAVGVEEVLGVVDDRLPASRRKATGPRSSRGSRRARRR